MENVRKQTSGRQGGYKHSGGFLAWLQHVMGLRSKHSSLSKHARLRTPSTPAEHVPLTTHTSWRTTSNISSKGVGASVRTSQQKHSTTTKKRRMSSAPLRAKHSPRSRAKTKSHKRKRVHTLRAGQHPRSVVHRHALPTHVLRAHMNVDLPSSITRPAHSKKTTSTVVPMLSQSSGRQRGSSLVPTGFWALLGRSIQNVRLDVRAMIPGSLPSARPHPHTRAERVVEQPLQIQKQAIAQSADVQQAEEPPRAAPPKQGKVRIERIVKKEQEWIPVRSSTEPSKKEDIGTLLKEQVKAQQKVEEETERVVTLTVHATRKRGGILGFLKSINNIGMGKNRMLFVQNLSMMLSAGLPLVESLRTLQLEIRQRAMRKVVAEIQLAVENGLPLWRAMEEQYLFSPYELALVRVGEEAGNLARNMEYLAEQQEKDHSLRQKVKMAMIYPSIVLVLMFVVVAILGMFVLPNLVQVLKSLRVELPLTTRIIIRVTAFFEQYGTRAVPLTALGMIVFAILAKYTPLRVVAQWMTFQIPGIGTLAKDATIARLGVVAGGLLEAGVPLVESLQSLEEVTTIVCYKKFYHKLVERIAIGDSFATCFESMPRSRKLLPAPVLQLIITGEKSGSLAKTFLTIANIYDRKAEETAKKLPVILEPVLLLIMGGMVGTIALSIIMPIYSAVGNVQNG